MDESKYLRKKKRALEEDNKPVLIAAVIDLAGHYFCCNKFELAIDEYDTAGKLYREEGNDLEYSRIYRMVGDCYIKLLEFDRAIVNYKMYSSKSLFARITHNYIEICNPELATQLNVIVEQQRALASLGHAFLSRYITYADEDGKAKFEKDLIAAKKYFKASCQLSVRITGISKRDHMEISVRLFNNLSVVAECMGEYEEAVQLLQKATEKAKQYELYPELEHGYRLLGNVRIKQDQFSSALHSYDAAIEVSKRLDDKATLLLELFQLKSRVFIKLSDFQSAKNMLRKAHKMNVKDSDVQLLEKTLKVVAKMSYTEDELVTTNSDDYIKKKRLFERMGDGATFLNNNKLALRYYEKMLESALAAGQSGSELVSSYLSMALTCADDKQYAQAARYFQQQLLLDIGTPADVLNTTYNIATNMQYAPNAISAEDALVLYRRVLAMRHDCNIQANVATLRKTLALFVRIFEGIGAAPQLIAEAKLYEHEMSHAGDNEDLAESPTDGDEDNDDCDAMFSDLDVADITDVSGDSDRDCLHNEGRRKRTVRPKTLNVRRNLNGETQLHVACIKGNVNLVRRLLDQGHPVNERDNAGWLPLHEAVNHGHKVIVEMLVAKGAAVNDRGGKDCDGTTPLHDAAINGHLEIIEFLLNHGASAIARNNSGETVLTSLRCWRNNSDHDVVDSTQLSLYDDILLKLTTALENAGQKTDNNTDSTIHPHIDVTSRRQVGALRTNLEIDNSDSSSSTDQPPMRHVISDDSDSDEGSGTKAYRASIQLMRMRSKESSGKRSPSLSPPKKKRPALLSPNEVLGNDWLETDVKCGANKRRKMRNVDAFTVMSTVYASKPSSVKNASGVSCSPGECTPQRSAPKVHLPLASSSASCKPLKGKVGTIQPRMTNYLSTGQLLRGSSANACVTPDVRLLSANCSPSPIGDSPVQPSTVRIYSVDVRVSEHIFNIAMPSTEMQTRTIKWLMQQTAKRYYIKERRKPVMELVTEDGVLLDENNSVAFLFPHAPEGIARSTLTANVKRLYVPSAGDQYVDICGDLDIDTCKQVMEALRNEDRCGAQNALSLRHMNQSDAHLEAYLKAVAHEATGSAKTKIDLTFNKLLHVTMPHLATLLSTARGHLTHLNLTLTTLTAGKLAIMANALDANDGLCASVMHLNLSYNWLGNAALGPLSRITNRLRNLRHLDLTDTKLETGIFDECDGAHDELRLDDVEELILSRNRLSKYDLIIFVSRCSLQRLTSLCVDRNALGNSEGLATELVAMFLNAGDDLALCTLGLADCNVCDFDIDELIKLFYIARQMKLIDLDGNPGITGSSVRRLFAELHILPDVLQLVDCPNLTTNWNCDNDSAVNAAEQLAPLPTKRCRHIKMLPIDFEQKSNLSDSLIEAWSDFHGGANLSAVWKIGDYLELSIADDSPFI